MAGEGGGGLGAVTGIVTGLVKFAKHQKFVRARRKNIAYQAARVRTNLETGQPLVVPRVGAFLPSTTGTAFGLARGFAAPSASASAPPPSPDPRAVPRQSVPQQIGDVFSGIVQGLGDVRWLETLEGSLRWATLIQQIRALLNPPKFSAVGGDMAYNFMPASFGGGSDLFSGLGGLAGGIASVINAIKSPSGMPGGMSFAPAALGGLIRAIPPIATGIGIGAGAMELIQGGGANLPTSPFTAGTSGARPTIFVTANPVTGKATWFRPAGRPILWSSDLSACRRVRKVAGRARRRLGGR